jgi:hypothetical protein
VPVGSIHTRLWLRQGLVAATRRTTPPRGCGGMGSGLRGGRCRTRPAWQVTAGHTTIAKVALLTSAGAQADQHDRSVSRIRHFLRPLVPPRQALSENRSLRSADARFVANAITPNLSPPAIGFVAKHSSGPGRGERALRRRSNSRALGGGRAKRSRNYFSERDCGRCHRDPPTSERPLS